MTPDLVQVCRLPQLGGSFWEDARRVSYLAFPSSSRVGDMLVRAASGSSRGRGSLCDAPSTGGGGEGFGAVAGMVTAAGWRWARAWKPALYWRGYWPECPAERWARLVVRAGNSGRHLDRAQELWDRPATRYAVDCIGAAVAVAVYLEGELRLAGYVTVNLPRM